MEVVISPVVTNVTIDRHSGAPVGSGGAGTVTTVSVVTANGVSGTVANPTTTPAITITLGAITPASVAAVGTVTGSNLSGTNTGDVTLAGETYISIAGQVITAAAVNLSGTHVTGTLAAARVGTFTGDVTSAGGSYALTIAANAVTTTKILDANVTLAKIATQADQTFLGNNTGGVASPIALTVAQAKTMLALTGTNSGDVTLAGENYLSIAGQVITAAAVNLAGTHVTGDLPFTNIQQIATSRILGRTTAGTGDIEELTVGTGLTLSAGSLSSSITQYTDEMAQDAIGAMVDSSLVYVDATPLLQRAALTGDVTAAAGSNATTIANDAVTTAKILNSNVTLAKIANIADATILGNNTGGAAAPVALTVAQTKTLLSLNLVENTALSTWAGSANITTLGTIATGTWNADIISLAKGGTGVALADPGADKLLFWDESAGAVAWLTVGTGLSITDTTIEATGGGGGTPGGSNTELQYNNGGAFGGITLATYNDATNKLTFGTFSAAGSFLTVNTDTTSNVALDINTSGTGAYGISIESSGGSARAGEFVVSDSTGIAVELRATGGGKLISGLMTSSDTNVATRVAAVFGHDSSGSVANNFGARIELQLESSTTAGQNAGYIQWDWSVASHATRSSFIRFYSNNGGTNPEMLRLGGGSSQVTFPQLGSGSMIYIGSGGVLTGVSMSSNRVIVSNSTPALANSELYWDSSNQRLGINQNSPAYKLHIDISDASTNTALDMVGIDRNSSGTPANGIGGAILFRVETSTTTDTSAVQVAGVWTDVTHASRTSAFIVNTVSNAGSLTERFRVGGLASKFSGGIQLAKAAKTANYTMLESDTAITSDATGGAVTITLPPATLTGHIVHVKRIDASGNNTTVSRAGSDTIEGATSVTLAAQYESVTLIADGTATWYIIATT